MLNVIKGVLTKAMENSQKFLEDLRMTLENLNNQSSAKANAANTNVEQLQQSNGDLIGKLIQAQDDRASLDSMLNNGSSSTNVPKTVEGSLPTVTASTPAPSSANTTVVIPSTTNTKTNTQNKGSASVKPFTGEITPEILSQYTKQYGVADSKVASSILRAAKTVGADPDILFKFAKAESNFNPKAAAKTSSATGLYQFLNSTWDYVMKDLGGKENFNLNGNRKDPYENSVAAALYINDIKKSLAPARKNGTFSTGELYLGHFAGPTTARKVIEMIDKGKGNVSANTIFKQNQINANKPIFLKEDGKVRTLAEVVQRLSSKVS